MDGAAFQTEVTPSDEMPEAGTIRLSGSVTYREAPEVRSVLLKEVRKHAGSKLVLALGDIEKIDTAGAAVLAEALKAGLDRGLRVLLCSPSPAVINIFRLAGFDSVLDHCCANPDVTWARLQN
jgi:anti-anti-sigma factor